MIILLFNISEKVLSFSDDFDGNELNLNVWKKANRLDCKCLLSIFISKS
jgi:hypothetical protein